MKKLFFTFLMLFSIDFLAFAQENEDEKLVEINKLPPQLVSNCQQRLPNAVLVSAMVNENIGDYAIKWTQGAKKGSILYRNNGGGVFGYVLLMTEYSTPKDIAINIPANVQQTFLRIITQGKTAKWTKIDNQNGAKKYIAKAEIDAIKVEFEINIVAKTKINNFTLVLMREGIVDNVKDIINVPTFEKMLNINGTITQKIKKIYDYAETKKYILSPFSIKFEGGLPQTSTQKGELNLTIRAKTSTNVSSNTNDKGKDFILFYTGDGKVQESSF